MGLMVEHGIIDRLEYKAFCDDLRESVKKGEYFFQHNHVYLFRKGKRCLRMSPM
jgi:hypothetical protein